MRVGELGVEGRWRRLRATEWGYAPLPREVTGKGHWEEALPEQRSRKGSFASAEGPLSAKSEKLSRGTVELALG